MADIKIDLTVRRDNVQIGQRGSKSRTTTADAFVHQEITVDDAVEYQFTLPADIVDAGVVKLENKSTANFLKWGVATGVYPFRVGVDAMSVLEVAPGTTDLFFLADTAPVEVDVFVAAGESEA